MSKNKCNMVINKARICKDHLEAILKIAQDIEYPLFTHINMTILELEKIVHECRTLRETYD